LIELQTLYGKLVVPIVDIHRMDLGTRLTEEDTKQAEALAAKLADPRFNEREEATLALQELGYKSFPVLKRYATHSDPEVSRRAEQLVTKLRDTIPADILDMPGYDMVVTQHSQIAGKIVAGSLRVKTYQFGDLVLKLADVRSLRSLNAPDTTADAA